MQCVRREHRVPRRRRGLAGQGLVAFRPAVNTDAQVRASAGLFGASASWRQGPGRAPLVQFSRRGNACLQHCQLLFTGTCRGLRHAALLIILSALFPIAIARRRAASAEAFFRGAIVVGKQSLNG